MMRKLRDLQGQVDERASEVARKESQMHMLEAEKDSAIKRLRDAEGEVVNINCQTPLVAIRGRCSSVLNSEKSMRSKGRHAR